MIGQQRTEIDSNSAKLNEIHELNEMGLGLPQLRTLKQTVGTIAVRNGLDGAISVRKLIDDIQNGDYDAKLGFAKKVAEIKRQAEDTAAKHEQLKMDYATDKDALESLKTLHSKQVKNHEIVSLTKILDSCSAFASADDGGGSSSSIATTPALPTITKIEQEIRLWGSLQNASKEAEKHHTDLLKANIELKKENEMLECNNESLKKASDNFVTSFQDKVKAYTDIAKSGADELKSTLDRASQETGHANDRLAASIVAAAKDVNQVLDAANEGSKKILENQRLLDYEPLIRAQRGEQVSKEAVARAVISAIDSGASCLTGIGLDAIKIRLQVVANDLKDTLKFSYVLLKPVRI